MVIYTENFRRYLTRNIFNICQVLVLIVPKMMSKNDGGGGVKRYVNATHVNPAILR